MNERARGSGFGWKYSGSPMCVISLRYSLCCVPPPIKYGPWCCKANNKLTTETCHG